jgi:hypothetical protein
MNRLLAVQIGEEWYLKKGLKITQAPQFQTTGALVSIILKNVYIAAGLLFFVLLIFGGISIILGAGGGEPKKTAQGQKAVVAAVTGFFIIFTSYWIVKIIEFVTGITILKLPGGGS